MQIKGAQTHYQETSISKEMKKLEPSYTTDRNVNGAATMKNNMTVPQKHKNRITITSTNAGSQRDIDTPVFITEFIHNS